MTLAFFSCSSPESDHLCWIWFPYHPIDWLSVQCHHLFFISIRGDLLSIDRINWTKARTSLREKERKWAHWFSGLPWLSWCSESTCCPSWWTWPNRSIRSNKVIGGSRSNWWQSVISIISGSRPSYLVILLLQCQGISTLGQERSVSMSLSKST